MGLPLVVSEYRERKILKQFLKLPCQSGKIACRGVLSNLCHILRGIHAHFVPICYAVLENKDTWSLLLFLGSWLLTMVSTLSIGLLVGGIAKNMKSASVIACILYFPMLIFLGQHSLFEVMPAAMQKIISMFPLTQGIQLMKATFLGLPIENVLLPVGFMGCCYIHLFWDFCKML